LLCGEPAAGIRRILPLAAAYWLMDGGDAFVRTLWPLLQ